MLEILIGDIIGSILGFRKPRRTEYLTFEQKQELFLLMKDNQHLNPIVDTCYEIGYQSLLMNDIRPLFDSNCIHNRLYQSKFYIYGDNREFGLNLMKMNHNISMELFYLYVSGGLKPLLKKYRNYIEKGIYTSISTLKMNQKLPHLFGK